MAKVKTIVKSAKAGKAGKSHRLTWLLIVINVIIFELVFSLPEAARESVFSSLFFSSANAFELWRWVTSLFLHASASHLFFNMVGLYFFGKILEEEVKESWYLAIYFVGGLLGNFVFMLTSSVPVIGASGAVFSIMGAVMFLNPVERIHMYLLPLPLGIVALAFAFFETLVVYFQPQLASAGVAHIVHIAGLITGTTFAFFYKPKKAAKGIFVLAVCIFLLVLLSPFFTIISSIGAIFLQVLDMFFGFFLYGLAKLISVIWWF